MAASVAIHFPGVMRFPVGFALLAAAAALGRVQMSAIGYSRAGTQAVLLLEHARGSRNATMWLVVVERDSSGWRMARLTAIGGA